MDEYGCDWDYTPERKPLTAVLAHPLHGRLIEKVVLMINNCLMYGGCLYTFKWKDQDVAFYELVA